MEASRNTAMPSSRHVRRPLASPLAYFLCLCLLALPALAAREVVEETGQLVDVGQPPDAGGRRPAPIPSIGERTREMKTLDGFFPMYWDEAGGRLFVEVPALDTEVLHVSGFATGLGSNDIGIDRGALTGSRIVRFERVGPRLLMVQPNYQYRGTSRNAAAVRDVQEAFARSVLWAFPIAAQHEGRVLVDFTEFLLRDAGDVAARLRPGTYRFESGRSTIYLPRTAGFPRNSEMEAELTFVRTSPQGAGGGRGAGGGAGGSWREWAAWPRQPRRPASASIIRSWRSRTRATRRG
jgi:hypothetical protein